MSRKDAKAQRKEGFSRLESVGKAGDAVFDECGSKVDE